MIIGNVIFKFRSLLYRVYQQTGKSLEGNESFLYMYSMIHGFVCADLLGGGRRGGYVLDLKEVQYIQYLFLIQITVYKGTATEKAFQVYRIIRAKSNNDRNYVKTTNSFSWESFTSESTSGHSCIKKFKNTKKGKILESIEPISTVCIMIYILAENFVVL